jgi:enoyl-CoA hydratase/carnithine racemase
MSSRFEHHGTWAEIILDRPHRKNAITGPLGKDLAAAFERAQADDAVQAVLLRGEGGAFCSGLDLDAFSADPKPDWMATWRETWQRAHMAIFACEKPIVCALERFAINGGAALAIASDFCITGETAFLQVGEVRIGMAAPYNLAWLRIRHSEAVSARVAMLGDRIAGPELARLGLATEVVDDANVEARARELSEQLASFPAGANGRIKSIVRSCSGVDAEELFAKAWALSGDAAPPPRRR